MDHYDLMISSIVDNKEFRNNLLDELNEVIFYEDVIKVFGTEDRNEIKSILRTLEKAISFKRNNCNRTRHEQILLKTLKLFNRVGFDTTWAMQYHPNSTYKNIYLKESSVFYDGTTNIQVTNDYCWIADENKSVVYHPIILSNMDSNIIKMNKEAKRMRDSCYGLNYSNWRKLRNLNSEALNYYIPSNNSYTKGCSSTSITSCRGNTTQTSLLTELFPLSENNAKWILGRILNFLAILNHYGYTHNDISSTTIVVMPDIFCVEIISFYTLSKINARIDHVEVDKSKNYFLSSSRLDKNSYYKLLGKPERDLYDAKNTIFCLMGANNISDDFFEFLAKEHKDPKECYLEYRKFLL